MDNAAIISFAFNFPPFLTFLTFLGPLCLLRSGFSVFFHLFKLFQTSYSTVFSLLRYSSFCLFNSFKHSASCSAMKMFNFSNSFNPLQLFCLFIFSNVHRSTFSPPSNIKLHVHLQKLFSYQYVQLFNFFSFSTFSSCRQYIQQILLQPSAFTLYFRRKNTFF